jgi:hypothetical protein
MALEASGAIDMPSDWADWQGSHEKMRSDANHLGQKIGSHLRGRPATLVPPLLQGLPETKSCMIGAVDAPRAASREC